MIVKTMERRELTAKSAPGWFRLGLQHLNAVTDEGGATLVEMALGVAAFLAMLIGVMQVSLALYTYNYVSDAAREGSRWAMVRGFDCTTNTPKQTNCNATNTDIQTYLQSLSYPGINSAQLTTSTNWYTPTSPPASWSLCALGGTVPCNQQGYEVQVTVTYPFPLSIPFWKSSTLQVSSTSTMVISQ